MCGEQDSIASVTASGRGSPPRVRGTVSWHTPPQCSHRITPACAGNRFPLLPAGIVAWDHPACAGNSKQLNAELKTLKDHPRVCGEQPSWTAPRPSTPGSPPRVRGTAPPVVHDVLCDGITPACAGNSIPCTTGIPSTPDHPRVCGEQAALQARVQQLEGSPPRVRGTAAKFLFPTRATRITPACAGTSSISFPASVKVKDHPRVCGEQLAASII